MTLPRVGGRYELLHRLGAGGMAEVWLARQTGPGGFEKLVVVKKILPALAAEARFKTMFLDEARTAADMRHPNVVHVVEVGDDDSGLYLVMEYLEGRDVGRIAARAAERGARLPLVHACTIVMDAAAGLHHAHGKRDLRGKPKGIVHRDVSPQNLVVTFDGATKVVDFGVAFAEGRAAMTEVGHLRGKVAYMAPEQIVGDVSDHRVDQFALGVVLWEITTGQRLFRRGTPAECLQAVVEGNVPRPSTVVPGYPAPLDEIVLTALAFRAADRFADCAELERALDAFVASTGEPTGPRRVAAFVRDLFPDAIGPTHLPPPPPSDGPEMIDATTPSGPPIVSTASTWLRGEPQAPSVPSIDGPGLHALAADAAALVAQLDSPESEGALAEIELARERFEAAADAALRDDDDATAAALPLLLALEALRRGRDADDALVARIDVALAAAERRGLQTRDVARLHEARGDVRKGRGLLPEALADYERALATARAARDEATEALVLRNVADVEVDLGRLDDAHAHASAALARALDVMDGRVAARCALVLGRVAHRRGDRDGAIVLYEEARRTFTHDEDARFVARVLGELAKARHEQGDDDQALALCEEARDLHRATGERRHEGCAVANLGVLLASRGEAEAARLAYDEALTILRDVGDRRGEGLLLVRMAALASASGNVDAAAALYDQARATRALEAGGEL